MKVTLYDKNPGKGAMQTFLKLSWLVGCWLQKLFGHVDDYHGIGSVDEMRVWLKSKDTTFSSIQYWGHGSPGIVWISGKAHGATSWFWLTPLLRSDSVIWFRVCSLFQKAAGESFSITLANHLNCNVAGHTRIIGIWQGGLHTRPPNSIPSWSPEEGTEIRKLSWLGDHFRFWNKNTIFCLRTSIPKRW